MTNMTLGQRISSRRKLIGLSQEDLAEELNVTRQSVSKWESDISIPEIDKLIALSKLFDVNIGWLLCIESDAVSCPGFSEEQLRTVEELLARYHPPKKRRLWPYLLALGFIVAAISLCAYFGQQISSLNAQNKNAIDRIYALSTDNENLKTQLDKINELLSQQTNYQQLLTDFFKIQAYTDDDLQNVSTILYMRPKVYQEHNTAFLSIENPITDYHAKVDCVWDAANQVYIANFTVPAADGYKFSFMVVSDYGYQEENLLLRDPGMARLGTYCTFHLDPASPQHQQMMKREPTLIQEEETLTYSFNLPIYTPHIFAKTAVAYKDIRITMTRNNAVIWEKSYLDAFKEAAGGASLNAANTPVMPDVHVSLRGLSKGDDLQLIITAETVNGGEKSQTYQTLLDYIMVE